ncbi:RNA polymerase sigma factor [Rugosimonospora africana]|uniref:DNA-directed RNA polymerase sigma-70 factor n=1 Tax=Rugosimonospora africana TaxID=556532 RepID=A0A8J3VR64_9ACTN|nr:RNA polymerase sigma factor [Rugosimonospora africana]GIH15088.1 DNA-directed RNA polymerase sigma-70 factor [Rugosimonospora africana]
MFEDDELAASLKMAVAGDEEGFAVLWRSLQPAVLRYLRVVVGDAAEDVASETWLQAARDLRGFDGGVPAFRVWLFRIARHRGIDELRRRGRRREEPTESIEEQAAQSPVRDVAAEVLEEMDTAWALELIATLPQHQAEAVMLRVVAGLDVGSAAEVLGKRAGTVRVATMRGLRRLAADPRVRAWEGAAGTGSAAAVSPAEGM